MSLLEKLLVFDKFDRRMRIAVVGCQLWCQQSDSSFHQEKLRQDQGMC
jgi:hypothetical protein